MFEIEEYRESFTVHVVGSTHKSVESVAVGLNEVGYKCQSFFDSDQALEQSVETPPHIVIYFYDQGITNVKLSGLISIFKSLPEVCVIVLATETGFVEAVNLYDKGAFDCLIFPMLDSRVLIKSVDRAVKLICSSYLTEQLKEKLSQPQQLAKDWDRQDFQAWNETLMSQLSVESAVEHFLKPAARALEQRSLIYFRYIETYRSLVATHSHGVESSDLKGIGVKLLEKEPGFSEQKLNHPERLIALRTLLFDALGIQEYQAIPVEVSGKVEAVLIVVGQEPIDLKQSAFILYFQMFKQFLKEYNLKLMVESHGLRDIDTQALQRKEFHKQIRTELARSRRIRQPVSLLVVSIDSLSDGTKYSEGDRKVLPRLVSQVIHKNCRVNDLIGRFGEAEFGIILPHTDKWGAAIKAERLRLILDSADFSKVLLGAKGVQVSVGISEYPSLCHDGEELFRSADEALSEVQKSGKNKVCLYSSPSHFEPDFDLR